MRVLGGFGVLFIGPEWGYLGGYDLWARTLARPFVIVVLLPPEQREPRHGDIVAALVDGETCLKRLVNKTGPAHLRSESHNPAFREIYPAHDLVIQGVVVGKL